MGSFNVHLLTTEAPSTLIRINNGDRTEWSSIRFLFPEWINLKTQKMELFENADVTVIKVRMCAYAIPCIKAFLAPRQCLSVGENFTRFQIYPGKCGRGLNWKISAYYKPSTEGKAQSVTREGADKKIGTVNQLRRAVFTTICKSLARSGFNRQRVNDWKLVTHGNRARE